MDVLKHSWLKSSPYYAIDMELCQLTLREYIADAERAQEVMLEYRIEHPHQMAIKWLYICKIVQDIANGLVFIHGCKEVHRDLKPPNGEIPSQTGS